MSPELSLRRLHVLSSLAKHFCSAAAAERLEALLDALLDATPAIAAAAFDRSFGPLPSAERRLPDPSDARSESLHAALRLLGERAFLSGTALRLNDVRLDNHGIEMANALVELGAHAALAVPLTTERSTEGVVLLLFADGAMLDEATLRYVDTVTAFAALALERDRGAEIELHFREELSETSRMATLGLYTASVAHEIKGPAGALVLQHEELSAIVRQLSLLSDPQDATLAGSLGELGELVADMGVAVERIRDTVSQLTTLGRRESSAELVRVADVVRESLTIARPHLERRGVLLSEELDVACFTLARRDNLAQVVLNLVLNAADATQPSSPPRVWVRVSGDPQQVVLSVEDNGPGVPASSVGDIFKPFYTTKPRGKGTGLGLKICSDVVAAHGGHIEVDARDGGGAAFRVVLPRAKGRTLAPDPSATPSQQDEIARAPLCRQRVLLVDDDLIFSRTIKRALRPHEVRVARSASEAEAFLLDPDYEPDVVLCDVLLPGANGNVLHAHVARTRPALAARFVFVTGGGLARAEADYIRASGCLTLSKPLDGRALLDVLRNAPSSAAAVRTLAPSEPPSLS